MKPAVQPPDQPAVRLAMRREVRRRVFDQKVVMFTHLNWASMAGEALASRLSEDSSEGF